MRVIKLVRDDERVVGQLVTRQVGPELREGYEIIYLRWAVDHVGNIRERIMALDVRVLVPARVAG